MEGFGCWVRKQVEKLKQSHFLSKSSRSEKERKRMFSRNGSKLLEETLTSCKDKCRCNPIRNFSAKEVLKATNHFESDCHDLFYYKWYKGTLDDRPLLLKKYACEFKNRAYRDIAISSQMSSHKNVLKLIGCCLEFSCAVLVYEYAHHGPLNGTGIIGFGSNGLSLSLKQRLKVAKNIANVITYLHTEFPRPIIYRDLNLSNIFLDKDFVPKLCNFGFSISIPEGENHVQDIVMGSYLYAEPEYVHTGFITEHTDVYSLGVTILVLVTGQEAIRGFRQEGKEIIRKYVSSFVENERFDEIVDPKILEQDGGMNEERQLQLRALLKLVLRCIEDRKDRPLMIDVAKELVKIERSPRHFFMNLKLLCKKLSMRFCFFGHSGRVEDEHGTETVEKKYKFFLENGSTLLEELISSCKGTRFRCNPIRNFSAKELLEATNNFKPYCYNDSDYKWYKATFDDRPVLIKRYHVSDYKFDKAYRDIAISTQMSSHKNVLKLLGCCLELRHPALVYEYAENGPFDNKGGLDSNGLSLPWKMRLKVAKGIANAMTYLHTSFPRPIIHRDLKLSCMFLDKDFVPKLCNFAHSVSIPEGKTHVIGTTVQGTVGFVDPDYLRTSVVTEHTDVYSFGIFLLVLLTGQSAFDNRRTGSQRSIHAYVADLVNNERFDEILDPKILEEEGGTNEELETQLRAFLKLASSCIETNREDRPLMIDVAKELALITRSTNFNGTSTAE